MCVYGFSLFLPFVLSKTLLSFAIATQGNVLQSVASLPRVHLLTPTNGLLYTQ